MISFYFANGIVNQNNELANGSWLKLDDYSTELLNEEYNKIVKSDNNYSFIIIETQFYLMIKKNDKIRIWKLGGLYMRKVSINNNNNINNKSVKLNKDIVKKKDFINYYKINIKII